MMIRANYSSLKHLFIHRGLFQTPFLVIQEIMDPLTALCGLALSARIRAEITICLQRPAKGTPRVPSLPEDLFDADGFKALLDGHYQAINKNWSKKHARKIQKLGNKMHNTGELMEIGALDIQCD